MVLELLSPGRWKVLSPGSRATQEGLQQELAQLQARFPEAKAWDLKRFLMGHGLKADKAAAAYEAHLEWRKANLPVAKESCLSELKKGRFYSHGKDKQGRPVFYYTLAVHDPKHRDLAEILRMMAYQMERVLAEAIPEEGGPDGVTIVWDTRDTGIKNTDNEFLREFLHFFKAQYPEVMAQMLVAPTGMLQRGVWNMACRFLDERRATRIKMLPSMESLLEYIDAGELLATHGGQNPWAFDPEQV